MARIFSLPQSRPASVLSLFQLVAHNWPAYGVGFALSISTICSLVSQIPAGTLIDSIHDKRSAVQLGTIGVGIAALLLGMSSAKPAVYLAQAIQGLGSSLIGPGIAAINLKLVGEKAFGERVGRNARFALIGNGLTAGIMGIAGSYFVPASIFLLPAVLTLPTLLSLSLIGSELAEQAIGHVEKQEYKQDAPKLTWRVWP
jgi:MFS family permease